MPSGRGPSVLQISGGPYLCRNDLIYTATKLCTVTHVGEQRVFRTSDTLHMPRGRGPSAPNFGDPPTYAKTPRPEATKFGMITHVVGGLCFEGSATSPSQGAGLARDSTNFLGPPPCVHTVGETVATFCTVITRCESNFYTVNHYC